MKGKFEGSLSKYKLADSSPAKPGVDIFYTPRGEKPVCNSACKGCYFFTNYKEGESAITASAVPGLVSKLKGEGYGSIYLISSETLLAPNWKEVIQATGDKYVNTNGKIIASQGDKILSELAEIGVQQLVMTANVTPSHQTINLTPTGIVETAFNNVKAFNAANPDKAFTTVATAILTTENYAKVPEICDFVHDVYGANGVKFIAYVSFSEDILPGIPELTPSFEQIGVAVGQIEETRSKFDQNEFYVQRGGSMGTQGLTPEKAEKFCPAGEALHVVKSLEDGAPVTPCLYIPQFPIGHMENGQVVVDDEKLKAFQDYKTQALSAGYCPALALNTALEPSHNNTKNKVFTLSGNVSLKLGQTEYYDPLKIEHVLVVGKKI